MKHRLLFGLATAALLSGCMTSPGRLTDSDFASESNIVDAPVAATYRNFLQGLRYCGPNTGVILGTHHGVAECLPLESDSSITCDMYVQGPYGGRSDFVLGRVDFEPFDNGTRTTFRVVTWAGNKTRIIDAWRQFTVGQAKGGVC
jgi:hypothetical protein